MAGLRVFILTDNAAFEDDWCSEAARILREAARRVEAREVVDEAWPVNLRDVNGNRCGTVRRVGGHNTE